MICGLIKNENVRLKKTQMGKNDAGLLAATEVTDRNGVSGAVKTKFAQALTGVLVRAAVLLVFALKVLFGAIG